MTTPDLDAEPSAVLPPSQRAWTDPTIPTDARLDALLAEMTLDEKLGQLGSKWLGFARQNSDNVGPMQDAFAPTSLSFEQARRHGLGHITRAFGTAPVTVQQGVERLVTMQSDVVQNTRLGIPAIVHEECLTGFSTLGATVYPAPIAWAATFDPELVERMASAIGSDLRSVGPRFTVSMTKPSAIGPFARIIFIISSAAPHQLRGGTTLFTSPMRYASAASSSSRR